MSVDTTAPAAVIEAVNISKSFGPVPVLFSVSMDVRPETRLDSCLHKDAA